MTASKQGQYRNGVLGNTQRTPYLVLKIIFKQIGKVLFQCF